MIGRKISKMWLENIKRLDDKNHLAHGEIYARDGSVQDFNIDNNTITAKVEGAPGEYFHVEITFKEFSNSEKKIIADLIENNSFVYSNLLNNHIDDDLLNIDVNVFPVSIKDFKMSCSCKRGLFCKHKAAVFHKLAQKINTNPFLVFSLRGFDLEGFLHDENQIKSIKDILTENSEIVFNDSGDMNYLEKLNFMLSDYPSFYNSNTVNFNDILYHTLSSMSGSIESIIHPRFKNQFNEYIVLGNTLRAFEYYQSKSSEDIKREFENKWSNPEKWDDFRIELDGNYEIATIRTGQYDNMFNHVNLKFAFFAFFAELNHIDGQYCENISFLKEIYDFTGDLIYSSALMPELFRLDNEYFHIRWIPVFEQNIYGEIERLSKKCPEDLLTFYGIKISPKNQVIALISLFFEGFCQYFIKKSLPHKLNSFKNETFFRLFFIKSQDLNTYFNRGKEIEIDNWLSVLYLRQKDYKLILNTEQYDFKFFLDFKIEIGEELFDFKQIIKLKRNDIIRSVLIIENIFSKFNFNYYLLNPKGLDLRQYSWFIDNVASVLKNSGVEVNLPLEFENVDDAKLVLNTNISKSNASLTLDDLNNFDWKIAIGDETFSVNEFETFMHNYRGLIKIRDKYFVLNEENLYKIRRDVSRIPESGDKQGLLRYLLSSDSDDVEIDDNLNRLIDNILNIEDVCVSPNLNGKLRNYQETGFSWLVQNMQLGFGSILADDMGLGKTIQILATILYLKENGNLDDEKVLIVAPTGILTNWAKEIEKFTPTLTVEIYHGVNRSFPENDFDILLTSYGMIRQDYEEFNNYNWHLLVVDEAQNIKNPSTMQTKTIKSIDARHHIALSGTPIENHLGEYWSIFDFVNKGYLYSLKLFKQNFMNPIEKERDEGVLDDFKRITSPFILRRLKTDKEIIKDLPDKIVNDIYCNLTLKQATLYEDTLNELIRDVENTEGIQRKGMVLKLINSLKQICNHPSQFLKLEEGEINESGKMEVLMNTLENIIESDEKVLIFTQYVEMGKLMKKLIEDNFGEEVLFLYGGVSRGKRDKMIDKFQNGNPKIFILSLKAGGIGLNLTAASNVIHYDLWWNPAVENQATDRAYRIGQKENVMVYRFITGGTLEENINKVLLNKRELVEITIDGNESFITEMDDDELRKMLNLRNEFGES